MGQNRYLLRVGTKYYLWVVNAARCSGCIWAAGRLLAVSRGPRVVVGRGRVLVETVVIEIFGVGRGVADGRVPGSRSAGGPATILSVAAISKNSKKSSLSMYSTMIILVSCTWASSGCHKIFFLLRARN